ncbi:MULTISPECIES: hypothetical protein [unclassified Arthrobacter]|uniref:hypothetical protein n=1 Tax=unclassified Arthrobacter TaxID=235627 RepID=UPI00288304A2|nr:MULTISPECIES: hypothetical protein [unclassified Arthrobacter]
MIRRVTSPQPVPDWSKLARDDTVTVLRSDGNIVTGKIDMLAVDRSVFWMIQNDGLGRIMIPLREAQSVTVSKTRQRKQ